MYIRDLFINALCFHLCIPFKFQRNEILILNLSLCIGVCYYIFTFQMVIMLILPFLVAMLYMNKRLLDFSGVINLVIVVIAHFVSALFVL